MIYTHFAAGLIGAAVAALGIWQVQDWRYSARIAQMEQAHTKTLNAISDDALAKQKDALIKLQELNTSKQKVEQDYAIEKRKAAVAANSARAELDRLRQELYTTPPTDPAASLQDTPAPCRVDGATIERQLLGECATTLVNVAGKADLLAAQLIGLQSYVRDVCSAPVR